MDYSLYLVIQKKDGNEARKTGINWRCYDLDETQIASFALIDYLQEFNYKK